MRIAQVAPLHESVPPRTYGGTERVVSYLTEELVRLGHDVTLFASGDSRTLAKLNPVCPRALRFDSECQLPLVHHYLQLEAVIARIDDFDIVHYHTDYLHFPLSRRTKVPQLTTLHGRLDLRDLRPLFAAFDDMPVVSISNAQRSPLSEAQYCGTVHHGLPVDLYPFNPNAGSYFAFIGRISPEKRADRAIEIATRLQTPLKIAAKIDRVDTEYFEREIAPLLDNPLVEFIGEISEASKGAFLGSARALLMPIDWPEPFGLVTIEAMACGTPVIAYDHGSMPEIIEPGVNGYLVNSQDEATEAAERVHQLDRHRCRRLFEERFSVQRMAQQYLTLYEQQLARGQGVRVPPIATSDARGSLPLSGGVR